MSAQMVRLISNDKEGCLMKKAFLGHFVLRFSSRIAKHWRLQVCSADERLDRTGFPVEQLRPTPVTDCCVQLQLAEAGHVGKQLQVQVRLMKLRHRCKTRLLSLRILWISAGVQSSWQKASVLARSYTGSNRSYTFSELSPPPAAPLLGSRYVDTISCKFFQRSAVFFYLLHRSQLHIQLLIDSSAETFLLAITWVLIRFW